MQKINIAIIGAGGYTGLELIKIILSHPRFEIAYLATRGDFSIPLSSLHPSLKAVTEFKIESVDIDSIASSSELVFLALPHKTSMSIAKELRAKGVKVVDLSADYRLERSTYEKFYSPHEDSENLKSAVYGLVEYYRDEIRSSSLVAGPGCYPTASLLALLPFVPYLDNSVPIFIDAKSGVSGAGKKLSSTTHFVTINENIFAYNPISHRHSPEIAEKIEKIYGLEFQIVFVPHLISATRGELVSIYATLKREIEPLDVLKSRYEDEEFIRVREKPVDIKTVSGTHFCDIFAKRDRKALFISSAIDNLLRGSSSQAVAIANLMMGFDESLGIPKIAYIP
jgi:N-acetyl-gamma-glutamyl-phosphate reductase